MRIELVVIAGSLLAGCTGGSALRSGSVQFKPVAPEAVSVFFSRSEIECPGELVIVGQVLVDGNEFAEQQHMLKKARKEAAKIGATGIVVMNQHVTWASPLGTQKTLRAQAVRCLSDGGSGS